MSIVMTSCKDDECDHSMISSPDPDPTNWVVGSWYESEENEEMRFGENGTFYDRYANYQRCDEVEGRYEYDNKNQKLTYYYMFMGQTRFVDWSIKNRTQFGFTISSSSVADHKLEKIVESYELSPNQTANISFAYDHPDYSVISYSSNNERIVSVSQGGILKAEGEKGITYVKVRTAKGNVWIKVTVGDNCADMWHDYVGLIGLDYQGIRTALSRLGEPYSGEDGYSFGFLHELHDVADITKVFFCIEDRIATEIQLLIKESVPEAKILSYLDSRYYKMGESGNYIFYSSLADVEVSKAIIAYNKSERCVIFNETLHFLYDPHVKDLWTDFEPLFGKTKNQVKASMDEYGYSFIMSTTDYSKDGSDYYYIPNNNYAQMVGFVFNTDQQVSEYWVYMDRSSDPNDVYSYLCAKYKEDKAEDTQYTLHFYNEDRSLRVIFDLQDAAVVYTNLTMKQHQANNEILGNYYEALGLTRNEIISKFGSPFKDDEESLSYIIATKYIDFAFFYMNQDTDKCKMIYLSVNEAVPHSTFIDYLNSKYKVFASGTAADGSQYAWTDGPTVAESTLGIIYRPESNLINYQPLGVAAKAKSIISSEEIVLDNYIKELVSNNVSTFHKDFLKREEKIRLFRNNRVKEAIKRFVELKK